MRCEEALCEQAFIEKPYSNENFSKPVCPTDVPPTLKSRIYNGDCERKHEC